MIARDNLNRWARWIDHLFEFTVVVKLKQVAERAARLRADASGDAAAGNFYEVSRIGGLADADDSPLITSLS